MSLKKGVAVAAAREAFKGAEPFNAYVVVSVHKDGTVDLAPRAAPAVTIAKRVATRHLTVIH